MKNDANDEPLYDNNVRSNNDGNDNEDENLCSFGKGVNHDHVTSDATDDTEEHFLLDSQLRSLVLKFFTIVAIVQVFIFMITSWSTIQSAFIDHLYLPPKPNFIYDMLRKTEKSAGYLVPTKEFSTMDLVAVYVSSSASPSLSYAEFVKQISQLVESRRPILSHIWGVDFRVYIMRLNRTNESMLISELVPTISEQTGKKHASSDTLHYVFVNDCYFKSSTKVIDGFGIVDYHSKSNAISDFLPTSMVNTFFQVAIGRTLEQRTLSTEEYEMISSKLSNDMELADYCRLLNDVKKLIHKTPLDDRPLPDLQYLSVYMPILSSVVLPVPMFLLRRFKARRLSSK